MRLKLIRYIHSRYFIILFIAGIGLSGCIDKGDIDQFVDQKFDEGLDVSVTEPVDRDFQEIKNSGVIRMITGYSSSTYFLHQGIERGFEYELVREFANEHDLALEVVIARSGENPYDLLNTGAGDLIASQYTVTPEREQYVNFTRPYNLVNQVIVYSETVDSFPSTLAELEASELSIAVRRNSSYYNRLQELRQQQYGDLNIQLVSNEMDTESLLFELSRGSYEAMVADDNIFQAASRYMEGLVQGPTIARNDTIAWAIRKNATDLETEMNRFLYKHFRFGPVGEQPRRSTFLNVLKQRYFEGGRQVAQYYDSGVDTEISDVALISPYDSLIKSVADSAGIDWLMVAAIIAQESKFNPHSESWAGAVGLMQILPRYSEVSDIQRLYNEQINLREGVRILSEHLDHYAYMDSTNQWAFALATYNAGLGHVADARRLAIDQNKDPNEWENVADGLLKLMQRQYYQNARFGFCRGIETVRYVSEIMNRRETYESILAAADRNQEEATGSPGVLGVFN